MCDEATDAHHPVCANFEHSCKTGSTLGVRARQFCPQTCGCDDPLSDLALYLPASGCGEQCARAGPYIERRRALPCTDVSTDDEVPSRGRRHPSRRADVAAGMAGDSDGILRGAGEERVRLSRGQLDLLDVPRRLRVLPLRIWLERVHGGRRNLAGTPDVPTSVPWPAGADRGTRTAPDACPARSLEPSETCLEHQEMRTFVVPEQNRTPGAPTGARWRREGRPHKTKAPRLSIVAGASASARFSAGRAGPPSRRGPGGDTARSAAHRVGATQKGRRMCCVVVAKSRRTRSGGTRAPRSRRDDIP